MECTDRDFVGNHTEDFRVMGQELGVCPVILCATDVSAGFKKRAYWASFPIGCMAVVDVDVNSVLLPGRRALGWKLPTVMASGTRSWNTGEVAFDSNAGKVGPLKTMEMERQMHLPDDFTWVEGVEEQQRHHQIGNAFHAGVLQHILECWVKHIEDEWDFDASKGFPREGPDGDWGSAMAKRAGSRSIAKTRAGPTVRVNKSSLWGKVQVKSAGRKQRRQRSSDSLWKLLPPAGAAVR